MLNNHPSRLVYTGPAKQLPGEDGDYQESVYLDDDGLYRVDQEDLENGAVWNTTPIRGFPTLADAKAFIALSPKRQDAVLR